MRQRTADHATEKSARERLEERLKESDKEMKRLKEQQAAYEEAGSGAGDMIVQKERDQLKVSYITFGIWNELIWILGIDEMFGVRHQLQATGHHALFSQ